MYHKEGITPRLEGGTEGDVGRVRFFIDANIMISGMVYKGNEYRLLIKAIPGNSTHSFVTSEHVIDEIINVMVEKFPKHVNLAKEFLNCLEIKVISREIYKNEMRILSKIAFRQSSRKKCAKKSIYRNVSILIQNL